jgi:hypothetical protein
MQTINRDQLPKRPVRADVNRHAISLTAHLLMAGVWLERQLTSVPKHGFGLMEAPGRRARRVLVVRTDNARPDQYRTVDS